MLLEVFFALLVSVVGALLLLAVVVLALGGLATVAAKCDQNFPLAECVPPPQADFVQSPQAVYVLPPLAECDSSLKSMHALVRALLWFSQVPFMPHPLFFETCVITFTCDEALHNPELHDPNLHIAMIDDTVAGFDNVVCSTGNEEINFEIRVGGRIRRLSVSSVFYKGNEFEYVGSNSMVCTTNIYTRGNVSICSH